MAKIRIHSAVNGGKHTRRELLGNQVSFLVNFTILNPSPVSVRVRVRVMFSQPNALPFLNFFFTSRRVFCWNWVYVTLVGTVCACVRAFRIYMVSSSITAVGKELIKEKIE